MPRFTKGQKMYKNVFLYDKAHSCLKSGYQFFDALKTKDRKIRGNCNLSSKVKFHELELSSPLSLEISTSEIYSTF